MIPTHLFTTVNSWTASDWPPSLNLWYTWVSSFTTLRPSISPTPHLAPCSSTHTQRPTHTLLTAHTALTPASLTLSLTSNCAHFPGLLCPASLSYWTYEVAASLPSKAPPTVFCCLSLTALAFLNWLSQPARLCWQSLPLFDVTNNPFFCSYLTCFQLFSSPS